MTAPRKLYGVTLKPHVKTPRSSSKSTPLKRAPTCWKPFAEPLLRIGNQGNDNPENDLIQFYL